MPGTRRVPINRQHMPVITASTIDLYRTALRLRRRAHLSEADRRAAYEAEAVVERILGGGIRRLWLPSIFDIDHRWPHPEDPDWVRAAELRRQLDAALAEAKQRQQAVAEPETAPA